MTETARRASPVLRYGSFVHKARSISRFPGKTGNGRDTDPAGVPDRQVSDIHHWPQADDSEIEERDSPEPRTFDLLGFTHYWERSQRGVWVVNRKTANNRLKRALTALAEWCRKNLHADTNCLCPPAKATPVQRRPRPPTARPVTPELEHRPDTPCLRGGCCIKFNSLKAGYGTNRDHLRRDRLG
jgi:hypothetical protein